MTEHTIDRLISRIVDKIETPAEWAEFRSLAATEPSAWEMLAEAQRDNHRLARLTAEATDFAAAVELPEIAVPEPYRFRRPLSAAAGWAAAAVVLLAWIATGTSGVQRSGDDLQTAGFSATPSADDSFRNYLERGQADGIVLGELEPKVLIDTRPLDNGAVEVVFVRQIIERRQVPSLVHVEGPDAEGTARATVVRPTRRGVL
jgi:hypothetical protein